MKEIMIFSFSLYELCCFFFIYSFFGWITEVAYATLKTGRFINRGFLNGPVCSIYGFGVVGVLLCLHSFIDNIVVLFVLSAVLTTLIEFITGFILEKFFHKKWWDYSEEPFNIKGYVCLRFAIIWGIGCVLVLKVVHPSIAHVVDIMPSRSAYILLILSTISYLFDIVVTILEVLSFNKRYKQIDEWSEKMRTLSDKIGEQVSNVTTITIEAYQKLVEEIKKTRIAKAFPNLRKNTKKD